MKGWLLGALVALLGVVLAALKADLQDSTVCQWLARKLIYRAAQRLPAQERARWREEWIRHDLDVPGRLLPLVRALDIFCRAGSCGRMLRGAPSPSQALVARVRAAWLWLRSLPTARARAKERQVWELSKQLHPSIRIRAQGDAEQVAGLSAVAAAAFEAQLVASGTARSGGSATLRPPADFDAWLAQEGQQFDAWLAQQRQELDDNLVRLEQEYRNYQDGLWRSE